MCVCTLYRLRQIESYQVSSDQSIVLNGDDSPTSLDVPHVLVARQGHTVNKHLLPSRRHNVLRKG